MDTIKTVDEQYYPMDPLLRKQREDVSKMRTSLLACSSDSTSISTALRNITVLRVFHQISRIIRYLDLMDKIEAKLYDSIESALDKMNDSSPSTWMTLISMQTKLQANMLESHKLLQPYLNIREFQDLDSIVSATSSATDFENQILDQSSRDRIRISAKKVLDVISIVDDTTA